MNQSEMANELRILAYNDEITQDEAIDQLVEHSNGGLTRDGAADTLWPIRSRSRETEPPYPRVEPREIPSGVHRLEPRKPGPVVMMRHQGSGSHLDFSVELCGKGPSRAERRT